MTDPQLCSKYWLSRKVICLVGYYGGFRNVELKSLVFENVEVDSMGWWFSFSRSKQRNKLEETTICVPRRQSDWLPCSEDSGRKPIDYDPSSVIDSYIEAVMQDLDCKREDLKGGFFKGTHGKAGKRFVKANVGKNTLAQVGVEVASELCLRAPESYTGHCWRRSAGTNASNSGVNVTTLMSMMGWSCPKTAMQYVKRSRITSLKMSMYLANVQRRNCADPFPSGRSSRKTKFVEKEKKEIKMFPLNSLVTTSCDIPFSSKTVESSASKDSVLFEIENFESEISTQDLLCDDPETKNAGVVSNDHLFNTSSQSFLPRVPSSVPDSVASIASSVTTPASIVPTNSIELSSIDPRLMNVLQNLQNHGSIQIHFNFGDAKK